MTIRIHDGIVRLIHGWERTRGVPRQCCCAQGCQSGCTERIHPPGRERSRRPSRVPAAPVTDATLPQSSYLSDACVYQSPCTGSRHCCGQEIGLHPEACMDAMQERV